MIIKETVARDFLRLIVWYPIRWLISVMPISSGFAFMRLMGDIHYHLSRNKRRLISDNLNSAFGGKAPLGDIPLRTRRYFRNHYINQLQIFLFPRLNRGNIENYHSFEGLEHVEAALQKGKGCILIHPHFGPAQLPLCSFGIMGYPVMQLGLPTDEGLSYIGRKVAFRLRMKYESKIPARILPADSFLRPIFDWLKSNKLLMITGDGAGGGKFIGKFIPIEFFGKNVQFPVGAVNLATRTGAPLLPMFIIETNGTYKTIIHSPIKYEGKSQSAVIAEFVRLLEDYCSVAPHLWHFWDEFADRIVQDKDTRLNSRARNDDMSKHLADNIKNRKPK